MVDGGRPGKVRGALTLRDGETMEMFTARSSGGGAVDDEAVSSAMALGISLGGYAGWLSSAFINGRSGRVLAEASRLVLIYGRQSKPLCTLS